MSASTLGVISWNRSRDEEGQRTYDIEFLVQTTLASDGPATVSAAWGLPKIGSYWYYGNDADRWAYCTPEQSVKPQTSDQAKGNVWVVSHKFSTKPLQRCQDTSIDNPLNEPPKLSGSFVELYQENRYDRNGTLVTNSSHELIVGPSTETSKSRPTVNVSLNVASSPVSLVDSMIDHLNDSPLWGLPARHVKFSQVSWSQSLYGTCNFYYTLNMGFEINRTGWDVLHVDKGTRALAPGGTEGNRLDYVKMKNERGEILENDYLDGSGGQLATGASPITATAEYSPQANLLLLGIPSML